MRKTINGLSLAIERPGRRPAWILLFCVVACFNAPVVRWLALNVSYWKFNCVVMTDDGNHGAAIDLVYERSIVSPAQMALRFRDRNQVFIIRQLDDLKGNVSIASGSTALRFCRLKTDYHFAFPMPMEQEVTRQSKLSLPNYGAQNIPADLFDRMKLAEAAVERVASGFEVDRWILQDYFDSRSIQLLHIRELVGRDGSYSRVLLGKTTPIADPRVVWRIPGRE